MDSYQRSLFNMSRTTIAYFEEITSEVEEKLGYPFQNPEILWEALQAPGSIGGNLPGRDLTDGNKRLALLGDAALKLVLLKRWYREGGSRGESSCSGPKYASHQ